MAQAVPIVALVVGAKASTRLQLVGGDIEGDCVRLAYPAAVQRTAPQKEVGCSLNMYVIARC